MDSKTMELGEATDGKLKVDDDSSPLDCINDGGDGNIDEDNEILGGEDYDWEENEGEDGYYWEEGEGYYDGQEGEGEEDYYDGEESDVSSREEGQEWDVDSFDDEVYFKPKKPITDEKSEKFYRYRQQLYRSRGFNVDKDCYSGSIFCRQLRPLDLDDDDEEFRSTGLTCREYINSMVNLSLDKYNCIKGSNVKGESVVRVIITGVMGIKCYITFMARETPDGDLVEYQAKTEMRVWQKKPHVIFCRPSPEPKEPPPDDECGCTDSSSEEDSDASSRYSDQEWDYDSFDEEYDYKPPRFNHPPDEEIDKMRLFRPLMRKSKGFDVDGECYTGSMRYFLPVNLDEELKPYQITGREYMEDMAKLAVEKYNEMKQSNVLTFHSIVRANLTVVNGFKSYITFMAGEVVDGDLVEYQAKTESMCNQRKTRAIFCRPSPKSKD